MNAHAHAGHVSHDPRILHAAHKFILELRGVQLNSRLVALLNRYPPHRDFVWLQILGTCHSSILTKSCKDFPSDAIWIIPAQWGVCVCVCGGALLPLGDGEDKVISSKKICTRLPLHGVRRAFPICTTPSTPDTNAVARMPGYANCRQASNEMKPEQSWSHMFSAVATLVIELYPAWCSR